MRLDFYLVEKGLVTGRGKAKEFILGSKVTVDNKIVTKPSEKVSENSNVQITGESLRYVSRGGLKLEKAIKEFSIDLEGKICIDIGSSTGGFTDCMLQHGAKKVYAVDVGSQQLSDKLRKSTQVVVMENTNIRYLSPDEINDTIEFISIDVSFISLKLVFPVARMLLSKHGKLVCLIKPQFEAGPENIGKNGVVSAPNVHEKVINDIVSFAQQSGFKAKKLDFSPIKGPKGNIEYLLLLDNKAGHIDAKNVVKIASRDLKQSKEELK